MIVNDWRELFAQAGHVTLNILLEKIKIERENDPL